MSTPTPKMWERAYPLVIECQTIGSFITLARPTTVLVASLERTIPSGHGSWRHHGAVHLTARQTEHRPILSCSVSAAQAEGVGSQGRLALPYQQEREDPDLFQRGKAITAELLTYLMKLRSALPGGMTVQPEARYRLPDDWVWSLRSGLDGSDIRFADGHWIGGVEEHHD